MADFSKEYADRYDGGKHYDFSYKELFDELQEGWYSPAICEGFGSVGVVRKDDEMYLVYRNDADEGEGFAIVHIDDVDGETYKEFTNN